MDGPPVRVAVVEDQHLMRSLLVQRLSQHDGITLIASAANVADARRTITPGSVDVVLLDVGLPDGNGIALGIELQHTDPRLRILLLSAEDALGLMLVSQQSAGSPWSFLSKHSALAAECLVETVLAVASGRVVIDPEAVRTISPRHGPLSTLSTAQVRVVRMVAQGLTNAAVAQVLDTTPKSVESQLTAIYRALRIDTKQNPRVAAVLAYQKHAGVPQHTHAGADLI